MISPGNSRNSQGFFLSSASSQVLFSATFRYFSLLWPRQGLSNAHSASSSWPSIHYPLERSVHLPYELALSSSVSSLVFCVYLSYLPSFWKVPDLSRSFCQTEARVYRSLWYFELTFSRSTMLPFIGVVDNSTSGPFFINRFLSLGSEGGLSSSLREIWGYLV
jgi:hypothetical protein